ncbi:unnamed protein product, partial [Rotaria sordida]
MFLSDDTSNYYYLFCYNDVRRKDPHGFYIFKTRILLLEMEYIPCVVLINLERKTIDSVRSDPFDQLFRSNNFIYKTQLCGCLQGFQMCHSLDNRIESGIMMRFNVIPSSKVSEIVVEPTIFHDRISMKEKFIEAEFNMFGTVRKYQQYQNSTIE